MNSNGPFLNINAFVIWDLDDEIYWLANMIVTYLALVTSETLPLKRLGIKPSKKESVTKTLANDSDVARSRIGMNKSNQQQQRLFDDIRQNEIPEIKTLYIIFNVHSPNQQLQGHSQFSKNDPETSQENEE